MPSTFETGVVFLMAGGTGAAPAFLGRAKARGVDWERVADVAVVEGAAGELLRRVPDLGPGTVPASVVDRLRPVAMVTDFRQRLIGQRLFEALDALQRAGIEAVALKGCALVATAYGAFERRPMSDIDLLVEPGTAARAREVLTDAGWAWDPQLFPGDLYARHHHLPPLLDRAGSGIALELHSELLPIGNPFAFGGDDVRARSVTVQFGGRVLRVPSFEDQLLHTLLHFAWSHAMGAGAWRMVADVAALCGTRDVEWESLVRLARASRGVTACYWALRLARQLGEVPVPGHVLAALSPALPEFVRGRLARHFTHIAVRDRAACPSVAVRRALWTLAFQPERNGHGAARPWLSGFEVNHATAQSAPGIRLRVAARIAALHRWSRFLAAMSRSSSESSLPSPRLAE